MNRLWIVVMGCVGLAVMMSLRESMTGAAGRAAISAAAFAWAGLAVVLFARRTRRS